MKYLLPAILCVASVFAAAQSAGAKPQRVMSIYLCSDQMVLDLLPPERIVSVTYLAHDSNNSYLAAEATRVGINYGTVEDILRQKPDLVVAGTYTTPATRAMLKRFGFPMIEIPNADNFNQIRASTRMLAKAVGEEARAEELIAHMDAVLANLDATRPTKEITVASWEGNGSVPGKGTLFDSILTAAGGINIAARDDGRPGDYDIERVLFSKPDILAYGDAATDKPALHGDAIRHPIIQKVYAGRQIVYPELVYSCGLPQSADAAKDLRAHMLAIMERRP